MAVLVLADKAGMYVQRLCRDIPTRRVGSRGNRLATDFFEDTAMTPNESELVFETITEADIPKLTQVMARSMVGHQAMTPAISSASGCLATTRPMATRCYVRGRSSAE